MMFEKHLPIFVAILLLFASSGAQAMSCAQGPLEQDIVRADAIFSGEILSVRYRQGGSWAFDICSPHRDGSLCGEKVARIAVDHVWAGTVSAETQVYSEDGCNCLGSYFEQGEEMLFTLVRYDGGLPEMEPIDYRTDFCIRTIPLRYAIEEGWTDILDATVSGTR